MNTLPPHTPRRNPHVIYALIDPRDQKEFYIGRTDDVYRRFQEHLRCVDRNDAKNAKILELRSLHLVPLCKTLEIIEDAVDAAQREAYWIRHFRYLNITLTNDIVYSGTPKQKPVQKPAQYQVKPGEKPIRLLTDDEVFEHYPQIWEQWLSKGLKTVTITVTIEEIMEVTGQSKRRLNKVHFQRSSRNQNKVLISSIIEWLKTVPTLKQDEEEQLEDKQEDAL